jgi:hypothetical protein
MVGKISVVEVGITAIDWVREAMVGEVLFFIEVEFLALLVEIEHEFFD